jgi:hypothetical protein
MKKNLSFYLITIYVLSIPLGTMVTFELLGNNVQLPEVVYLPLLVFTLWKVRWSVLQKIEWNWIDVAAALYATSVVVAWAINRTHNAFGEVVACGYLMSLYGVLRYWNTAQHTENNVEKTVAWTGYIAAIFGILGYILAYWGINNWVRLDDYYPFLGEVFRAKGFFANPIFFVTHVGSVLFLILAKQKEKIARNEKNSLFGLGLIALALILTKIKSLLSLFGVLCFVFASFVPSRWFKISSRIVGTIAIIAYLFFSHWLILDRTDPNFETKRHAPFYSTNTTWTPLGNHYALMPTFYHARKELAYYFGKKAFPWGIGGNELYWAQDSTLEAQGVDLMRENAPHSTFWGVFAELGGLGLIAIFTLFVVAFQTIRKEVASTLQPYFLGLLAFLFLEAITVDLMNVRVLWVLLAMLSSCAAPILRKKHSNPYF